MITNCYLAIIGQLYRKLIIHSLAPLFVLLLSANSALALSGPTCQTPCNNNNYSGYLISFFWSDVAGAVSYRLQIAKDTNFSVICF